MIYWLVLFIRYDKEQAKSNHKRWQEIKRRRERLKRMYPDDKEIQKL